MVELPLLAVTQPFLPRLPKLKQALPNLEVRVATHWADTPDFSRPEVDVIVAHGQGSWPNVHAVPVMEEMLTPYCAPAVAARWRRGTAVMRTCDSRSIVLCNKLPSIS